MRNVFIGIGLGVALLALAACSDSNSRTSASPVPAVLQSALQDIGNQTKLPIVVPSQVPELVKRTWGSVEDNGDTYNITLYASNEPVGDSADVGFIEVSRHLMDYQLPNTRSVSLGHGITGTFRPVSCGGSCAPANLWWQRDGLQYTVQLVMPSDTAETVQEKRIVDFANSLHEVGH